MGGGGGARRGGNCSLFMRAAAIAWWRKKNITNTFTYRGFQVLTIYLSTFAIIGSTRSTDSHSGVGQEAVGMR